MRAFTLRTCPPRSVRKVRDSSTGRATEGDAFLGKMKKSRRLGKRVTDDANVK